MKKKILLTAVCLSVALATLGCKEKSSGDSMKDYVTLGKYKGIEVSKTDIAVTDEELTEQIQSILESNQTSNKVTEGAVADGDTVNIDYAGTIDGVAFDGGTATAQDLEIGSGSFIDGFESGLIGATVGSTVTLNLTFPTDYSNTDLAGKAVVFTVKINYITTYTTPELTDAFVATISEYTTVDDFKAYLKQEMIDYNKDNVIMQAVLDNVKVKKYPEDDLADAKEQAKTYFEQLASQYSMDYDSILQLYGTTEDEAAKTICNEQLAIKAIAEAEDIEVTDKEYTAGLTKYATQYGVDSSTFETQYGADVIKYNLLYTEVQDFLRKASVEVEGTTETTTAADTTDTTATETTTAAE